jgi:hypothetical protein
MQELSMPAGNELIELDGVMLAFVSGGDDVDVGSCIDPEG